MGAVLACRFQASRSAGHDEIEIGCRDAHADEPLGLRFARHDHPFAVGDRQGVARCKSPCLQGLTEPIQADVGNGHDALAARPLIGDRHRQQCRCACIAADVAADKDVVLRGRVARQSGEHGAAFPLPTAPDRAGGGIDDGDRMHLLVLRLDDLQEGAAFPRRQDADGVRRGGRPQQRGQPVEDAVQFGAGEMSLAQREGVDVGRSFLPQLILGDGKRDERRREGGRRQQQQPLTDRQAHAAMPRTTNGAPL